VTLLDDVAEAAARKRETKAADDDARDELRRRIRIARDEGIPFAAIARAAQMSRERVRQLYAGK
jgi:hypothetical protein